MAASSSQKVYWGYDAEKGRLHTTSEGTGNLRTVMERIFGRKPLYRAGDVLGEYEHVEDPDTTFVHVYYGVKPPVELIDRIYELYPSTQIRTGKFEPKHSKLDYVPFYGGGILGPPIGPQGVGLSSAEWAQRMFGYKRGQWLAVRTASADMEGVMVALYPDPDVADRLSIEGGEPAERLHITLLYFKEKAKDREDWGKLPAIIDGICMSFPPLEGEIGGYGVFHNSEEGPVLWAHPDVPGLVELRQELLEAVERAGFEVSDDHGYSPHITLKYGHEGEIPASEPIPVGFDAVYFVRGDSKNEGSQLGKD